MTAAGKVCQVMESLHVRIIICGGMLLMVLALLGKASALGECSAANPCALENAPCCSKNNFCGPSEEYCTDCIAALSLEGTCNHSGSPGNSPTAGACGPSRSCTDPVAPCCSVTGFCGGLAEYCTKGKCQAKYSLGNKCGGTKGDSHVTAIIIGTVAGVAVIAVAAVVFTYCYRKHHSKDKYLRHLSDGKTIYDEEPVQGVHVLYNPGENFEFDLVFFHGLQVNERSSFWRKTWTSTIEDGQQEVCWPQSWLQQVFPSARIVLIEYESRLNKKPLPPQHLAQHIHQNLGLLSSFGSRPYFLVGHSMGGLVAKQVLLQTRSVNELEKLNNCVGLVFFGVPNLGSALADFAVFIRDFCFGTLPINRLADDLKMFSDRLDTLNMEFRTLMANQQRTSTFSFVENRPTNLATGIERMVVERASAAYAEGWASMCIAPDADHYGVCKPNAQNSVVFQQFVRYVDRSMVLWKQQDESVRYSGMTEPLT